MPPVAEASNSASGPTVTRIRPSRSATHDDLPRIPVEKGTEILDGELGVPPRPAARHALVPRDSSTSSPLRSTAWNISQITQDPSTSARRSHHGDSLRSPAPRLTSHVCLLKLR